MAHRRTIGGVILNESTVASSVGSPLRRRSMAATPATPAPNSPQNVGSNDDESEILARRRLTKTLDSSRSIDSSGRRLSLGMVGDLTGNELTEHYQKCIKLCAENKITAKNVFGLSVIDYISVLSRRGENTDIMQTAQATLDVSTKIYGLRVDCVHSDILRMAGNPVKEAKRNSEETEAGHDPDSSNVEAEAKRKKKRRAQNILCSIESITARAETLNLQSTKRNSDSQTTDKLLQATYPLLVDTGHSLHLYEDLLLEFLPEKDPEAENNFQEFEIQAPEDFADLDICPMLKDFHILGWSEADIPKSPSPPPTSRNEDFRFDLDASLVADNADNEYAFFDPDNDSQENVDRCVRRPEQVEHIVDFCKTVAENAGKEKTLEYSYIRDTNSSLHWAGPNHWKPHGLRLTGVRTVEVGACGQEKRKKRQIPDLEFTREAIDAVEARMAGKIKNLQTRTVKYDWPKDKLLLPDDIHYDAEKTTKFYYATSLRLQLFRESGEPGDAREGHNATVIEDIDYDYNNDNDTQDYCSQNHVGEVAEDGDIPEELDHGAENVDPEAVPGSQAFIGDNLVAAPKSTQQILIQYSTRAKKINMKQLKDGMWKSLRFTDPPADMEDEREPEDREERMFSQMYKKLEGVLGKEASQALTPALAFASLLHLANEKNLSIESTQRLADLRISRDRGLQNFEDE